jgi:hypothetical protein
MQIDFHHAVTYVIARLAGFSPRDAGVVAHASQYVDDATEDGTILFSNGARYSRISSAHKMLDYRNFTSLAASRVWLPFHFLPGNMGLPAGEEPEGPFINRLITIPNSSIARDMVRAAVADRGAPHGLHRLGITMHVYADTWAHQGFAGLQHAVNGATELTGEDGQPDQPLVERVKNYFVNNALPLGHGTVLSHPDRPYLVWQYTNGLGERITRNNPDDYLDASEHMCRAMQCYLAGDPDADAPGLPEADRVTIQRLLRDVREGTGEGRHAAWCREIAAGTFGFGPEELVYVDKGPGSWKAEALGEVDGRGEYEYSRAFLASDWKRFHDALILHRYDVVYRILPSYGICTA